MDASYRRGVLIVAATFGVAAVVCVALVGLRPRPSNERAGHDLSDQPASLGAFRLTERSGQAVTEADLAGRVWVSAFIFTRCPSSCPRISAVMKGLQDRLAGSDVLLVSLSVDPDHDTPGVLSDYADRFGARPERWWFLTGPKADVYHLILDRFHLGVAQASPEEQKAGAEAVSHSARLALVDRGNRVVGYFDADDPAEVKLLEAKARQLDRAGARPWVRRLPEVNASLNAASAILLLVGWRLIRAGRVPAHAACMALSVAVTALFLACYLVYHYHVGSVPFRGVGPIRLVYFTILLSHTVLAMAVAPMVIVVLWRALRRQFSDHARLARLTFPIWLYVSITGVIIYLMLYRLDVSTSLAG